MLSSFRPVFLPVALLVVALQALCAVSGGGSVLCVERDGCVTLEVDGAVCCADECLRSVEAQRGDRSSLHQARRPASQTRSHLNERDGRCVECTDVRIEAGNQRPARSDAPPLRSASSPLEVWAPCPAPRRTQTPAAVLSVDRHPLQALETVVLRR